MQEYALARDELVVCGDMVTNWDHWLHATIFLAYSNWKFELELLELSKESISISVLRDRGLAEFCGPSRGLRKIHESIDGFYDAVLRMNDIRSIQGYVSQQRWTRSTVTFPLQRVLGVFWISDSSQPEDRIYAYLGLVPKASWQGLTIDYARRTSDTYVQATRAMIRSTQGLSILSYVEDRMHRKLQDLPSWVPDYTALRNIRYFDPGSRDKFAGLPSGHFECTKRSLYTLSVSDTLSRTLEVHGILLGMVEDAQPWGDTTFNMQKFYGLNQSSAILQCVRKLPQDVFWRTLISDADIWDDSSPASAQSARSMLRAWIMALTMMMVVLQALQARHQESTDRIERLEKMLREAFINYVVFSRDYQFPGTSLGIEDKIVSRLPIEALYRHIRVANVGSERYTSLGQGTARQDAIAGQSRVNNAMIAHMSHRALFTISDGRIGKGPKSTLPGDQVWLLMGANVPYILRHIEESRYELVGEAYVHGVMHGEVFSNDEAQFKAITLV